MFTLAPGVFRTTSIMRPETDASAVMIGSGADANRVAYYSSELSLWILVNVGSAYPYDCTITFNGATLIPNIKPVHGRPAWVGSYCIYWDPIDMQWVARSGVFLGYFLNSSQDEEWWSYSGVTPYSGTYTARGAATQNKDAAITAWPRWECATQFGEYTAAGGASGTRIIGLPYWADELNAKYVRTLNKIGGSPIFGGGHYGYGAVYYHIASSAWVIGTPGDAAGWWVGSEPSTSSTTTFVHTEEEPDIVLTYQGYAAGLNHVSSRYIGEAAIWRI